MKKRVKENYFTGNYDMTRRWKCICGWILCICLFIGNIPVNAALKIFRKIFRSMLQA